MRVRDRQRVEVAFARGPKRYGSRLMRVLHTQAEVAAFHGCALVPTMGALHAGHVALIAQAMKTGLPVVVTIFVNPTQFGPAEDFAAYPRTLESDLLAAEHAGAAAVFVPDAATMYPDGIAAAQREAAEWPLPAVAREPGLEDACRPGHFGGVCQVVSRLYDLTRPQTAIFGEKDYQQLRVLTEMARAAAAPRTALATAATAGATPGATPDATPGATPDATPAPTVIAAPTVREPDGLAMSSRNRYLRPEQRQQALGLVRALQLAATAPDPAAAENLMRKLLQEHDLQVDYAVVRDAVTLRPITDVSQCRRGVIAARLDTVRLIDNMALPARNEAPGASSAAPQAALGRK